MKCNKCQREKTKNDFFTVFDKRRGTTRTEKICKKCKYKYSRQWKKQNRDKCNASTKIWVSENKEKYNKCQRKTYWKYVEKRREYGRNLWHKYKDKWNAVIREKRKILKEKYGFCHNTFERNGGVEKVIAVYERAGYKCELCGGEYRLQIHHKDNQGRENIKKGLKPNNKLNNLQVLCVNCHLKLHKKLKKH